MPKYGISLKIDVTKLDKTRFFKGQKGTYADLTCFIDTEELSQYGDNGVITQSASQEERQNGVKMPIIGNSKIFYRDYHQNQNSGYQQSQNNQKRGFGPNQDGEVDHDRSDIPF